MKKISSSLQLFITMAKVNAVMTRRFDGRLGSLGFTDFMILYYLSQSSEEKLRRVDLADKIGLTASGVTRLLAPMEKIGLVKREANSADARVSFVTLAPSGKRMLGEFMERAELLSDEVIPNDKHKKLDDFQSLLNEIGGNILWN